MLISDAIDQIFLLQVLGVTRCGTLGYFTTALSERVRRTFQTDEISSDHYWWKPALHLKRGASWTMKTHESTGTCNDGGGGNIMNINIRTQKPRSTCKQMNSLVERDVHKPPQAPVNKHNRSRPNNTLRHMNDKNLPQGVRPLEVSHNRTIRNLLWLFILLLDLTLKRTEQMHLWEPWPSAINAQWTSFSHVCVAAQLNNLS